MVALLAIGVLLIAAGLVLLLNLGGAADQVIRRVTSRYLGQLAPGYAATPGGFRVYSVLLIAIGLAGAGLGLAEANPQLGLAGVVVGLAAFAIASVIAIRGEFTTYRQQQGGR